MGGAACADVAHQLSVLLSMANHAGVDDINEFESELEAGPKWRRRFRIMNESSGSGSSESSSSSSEGSSQSQDASVQQDLEQGSNDSEGDDEEGKRGGGGISK